jgi:hypothetical protein
MQIIAIIVSMAGALEFRSESFDIPVQVFVHWQNYLDGYI